jgi:hypothetical protein
LSISDDQGQTLSRVSAMQKIVEAQRIIARDQNKVFVELADARRLSPADAEDKYYMDDGKGNAYIEFHIEPEKLEKKFNNRLGFEEYFITGDVDLTDREPEAFFNIGSKRWKPKQ